MRFLELGSQGVVTYGKTLIRGISPKDAHQKLLGCFFDCNRYCYRHSDHGVVTYICGARNNLKTMAFPLLNTRFMCACLFRSHLRGRNVDENLSTLIIPHFAHNVKHSISPAPLYHKTVGFSFALNRCARFL